MTDGGDDGYVHHPDAFDGDDESTDSDDAHGEHPDQVERSFGWRGWVLVGWLVVAFVAVPAYLFFFPRAGDTLALFGLSYRDTFLFLPLIPAIVLGALAVWATTRP